VDDTTLTLPDAEALLATLIERCRALLSERGIAAPRVVGIHTGGVWLAERLAAALELPDPVGTLDISFYRDDVAHRGVNPTVKPSQIPWEVDGADLLLVDDILWSGRTIRAALNELFDYGRPRRVLLVTLLARDGRELPIQPDACAATLTLPPGQLVKLRGPAPLSLALKEVPSDA
jgi:pyrimidine operon attenuation protein/uracil phosphoribosyltransferase